MRVERGEHAVDRTLDEDVVVDLFDIVAADALEHGHEVVELLVGRGVDLGEPGGGRGHERQRADQAMAGSSVFFMRAAFESGRYRTM